jgi:hypothetical protein
MKDFCRWVLKSVLMGIAWVFVLSIPVRGDLLFHHAHDVLVQNSLIDLLDRELNVAWDKLKVTARAALADDEQTRDIERTL